MPDIEYSSPFGSLRLFRFPKHSKEQLRAWDAADEYILETLKEKCLPKPEQVILLVNDSYGALSLALNDFYPYTLSDSSLAFNNIERNALENQIPYNNLNFVPANALTEESLASLPGKVDMLIIKIPKTLALLEYELEKLRPLLDQDSVIIAAGMTRHIHNSTINLFENFIGPSQSSLAKKKARLIFSDFRAQPLKPSRFPLRYELNFAGNKLLISNYANVFSQDSLDIGTRFFISTLAEKLARDNTPKAIVDLACGNGVVGIIAAMMYPEAEINFTDESYLAIASAKRCFQDARSQNLISNPAKFYTGDCLQELAQPADLILCNPPFHQQHAISEYIAWRMFLQSSKLLNNEGELWIVANRHLNYQGKLKRLFKSVVIVASNRKFVVFRASQVRSKH